MDDIYLLTQNMIFFFTFLFLIRASADEQKSNYEDK